MTVLFLPLKVARSDARLAIARGQRGLPVSIRQPFRQGYELRADR